MASTTAPFSPTHIQKHVERLQAERRQRRRALNGLGLTKGLHKQVVHQRLEGLHNMVRLQVRAVAQLDRPLHHRLQRHDGAVVLAQENKILENVEEEVLRVANLAGANHLQLALHGREKNTVFVEYGVVDAQHHEAAEQKQDLLLQRHGRRCRVQVHGADDQWLEAGDEKLDHLSPPPADAATRRGGCGAHFRLGTGRRRL